MEDRHLSCIRQNLHLQPELFCMHKYPGQVEQILCVWLTSPYNGVDNL